MNRKETFNIRIGSTILIIGFLVIEVTARVLGFGDPPLASLDSKIEYYPKENGRYKRFGNRIDINRHGMRSRDFDLLEKFDISIALLGDSVVYGNHFLDQNETIVDLIDKSLIQNNPNEKTIASAIAASSWGPGNILAFYRKLGEFKGDYAVLIQSSHDRWDIPFLSTDVIPYRVNKSNLASMDLFWAFSERALKRVGFYERPQDKGKGMDRSSEPDLKTLIKTLKRDFDEVYLVFHPTVQELEGDVSQASYYKDVAREEGVNFEDFTRIYNDLTNYKEMYRDNIHPSEAGAKLISSQIQDLLFSR